MNASLLSVNHSSIKKWKALIEQNEVENFFMQPEIFKIFCDGFKIILSDDEQSLMPVPIRKKGFIPYVYQIPFIQRLSVIGSAEKKYIDAFWKVLSGNFPLVHFDSDDLPWPNHKVKTEKKNYILSLNRSYNEIKEKFTAECKKNIQKAYRRGCVLQETSEAKEVIDLYDSIYGKHIGNHLKYNYNKAFQFLNQTDCYKAYKVLDLNNEVMYRGIIVFGKNRMYYWLGAPTAKGREKRATYFFINEIIKSYCNSDKILDFEGSDFPGVARFYSSFTPQTEKYLEIKSSWLF